MSTVSSSELREKLKNTHLCRCKWWVTCGVENCDHYEPHPVHVQKCMLLNPVKYCKQIKGFVHCVPMGDIDSNYECNPNLAFKAKRDAEARREKSSYSGSKQYVHHKRGSQDAHSRRWPREDDF